MNIRLVAILFLLALPLRADEITAISRDKKVAAVVSDRGKISQPQIWTLHPWKRRNLVAVDWGKISSPPALSSGGSFVAWGCADGTLRVFSARNGRLLARLGNAFGRGYNFPYLVSAVAFSSDGRTLASANAKGLFVWNWRTRKLLFSRALGHLTEDAKNSYPFYRWPLAVKFSPNGRHVAAGGRTADDENVHISLFDTARGRPRHIFNVPCGDGSYVSLDFSPGGNRLLVVSQWFASASSYDQANLFDTRSGRTLWHVDNIVDPGGGIYETDRYPDSAAFSSDGRHVAIGGLGADDGAINFLEIRRASNGKLLSLRTDKAEVPTLETQKRLRAELGVR